MGYKYLTNAIRYRIENEGERLEFLSEMAPDFMKDMKDHSFEYERPGGESFEYPMYYILIEGGRWTYCFDSCEFCEVESFFQTDGKAKCDYYCPEFLSWKVENRKRKIERLKNV